jgi:hypothetical protein
MLSTSHANTPQILTGILRHYAMTLLQTTPKKVDLPKIRQTRSLIRGVNLRSNANVLTPSSFDARKSYMVQAYQEGKFLAEPELRGKPRPNPMSDPAAMEGMMGMMKGNMAMMVPQSLIMGWINAFFSGFVISKFAISSSVWTPQCCFCEPVVVLYPREVAPLTNSGPRDYMDEPHYDRLLR